MSTDGRSQMTAGRKSHNSDIFLVYFPYSRTVTDGTHRLIGITQRNIAVSVRHTVFQDKESDTLFVEIFCPLMSLMVHCKMRIPTSRTIYYSSSWGFLRKITGKFTLSVATVLQYELASGRLSWCCNCCQHQKKRNHCLFHFSVLFCCLYLYSVLLR